MSRFWRFLDDLELREHDLHGWRYTWSNERRQPTSCGSMVPLQRSGWAIPQLHAPSGGHPHLRSLLDLVALQPPHPVLLLVQIWSLLDKLWRLTPRWFPRHGLLRCQPTSTRLAGCTSCSSVMLGISNPRVTRASGSVGHQLITSREMIFCLDVAMDSRLLSDGSTRSTLSSRWRPSV